MNHVEILLKEFNLLALLHDLRVKLLDQVLLRVKCFFQGRHSQLKLLPLLYFMVKGLQSVFEFSEPCLELRGDGVLPGHLNLSFVSEFGFI